MREKFPGEAPTAPFRNCQVHDGFANIGDGKASKSKGNFLALWGACPTPDDFRAYRYLVVSLHHGNPPSFTDAPPKATKTIWCQCHHVESTADAMSIKTMCRLPGAKGFDAHWSAIDIHPDGEVDPPSWPCVSSRTASEAIAVGPEAPHPHRSFVKRWACCVCGTSAIGNGFGIDAVRGEVEPRALALRTKNVLRRPLNPLASGKPWIPVTATMSAVDSTR